MGIRSCPGGRLPSLSALLLVLSFSDDMKVSVSELSNEIHTLKFRGDRMFNRLVIWQARRHRFKRSSSRNGICVIYLIKQICTLIVSNDCFVYPQTTL